MNQHFRYLIVGGGMTADSAVRGIRMVDSEGKIAIFTREPSPPYNRPPLSKGLWKRTRLNQVFRNTDRLGASIFLNNNIGQIDPQTKTVSTEDGSQYSYERLLLATGGSPIAPFQPSESILYYRTLQDYQAVRTWADAGASFIIIGAGFSGSELAAALSQHGNKVSLITRGPGIGSHIFPSEISNALNSEFQSAGIFCHFHSHVDRIQGGQGSVQVHTTSGTSFSADVIVISIGIRPNTELALQAGLAVNHGIRVDRYLQTSVQDIYAAGDNAEFFNPALADWMLVEHEENANQGGLTAGQNMAGGQIEYTLLPYFYTDLFSNSFYGIGETDTRHEVYIDPVTPGNQSVVYYLAKDRIRGLLLKNFPYTAIETARQLIAAPGPFTELNLKGVLSG
jgi:3-phenylpropionate/trans-cinnamate dioxygenase ferredoxin reductase component